VATNVPGGRFTTLKCDFGSEIARQNHGNDYIVSALSRWLDAHPGFRILDSMAGLVKTKKGERLTTAAPGRMKGRRALGPPSLTHQVLERPMGRRKGGIGGRTGCPRGGEDHRFHQRQAAHQIGPLQRKAQRHRSAKGMPDQINRPTPAQPFGELCRGSRGHRLQIALPVPDPGAAMAGLVKGGQRHARQGLRHA
jgi:hypothetical protein